MSTTQEEVWTIRRAGRTRVKQKTAAVPKQIVTWDVGNSSEQQGRAKENSYMQGVFGTQVNEARTVPRKQRDQQTPITNCGMVQTDVTYYWVLT